MTARLAGARCRVLAGTLRGGQERRPWRLGAVMTARTRHDLGRLAASQHHLLTTSQLHAAGLTKAAIRWAADDGRLHRVHPGVYAVGRPDLTREQRWLAAVLACGDGALLSHRAAARLWELVAWGGERPEVVLPHASGRRGRAAFDVHRS